MREVDKLERTSEQSPEVGWIRTWLDTILDIPWNDRTEDAYDMVYALGQVEGILVGQSSGAAMVAALRVARRLREGTVVTVFADFGDK